VAPADLTRAVGELAGSIAANAPLAVRAAKRAIRYGLRSSIEAGLELEGQLQRMLYASADCQEGILAFRERRPPRWAGR
jgi:enoyl-CoA hydratase/carnithine racemase